MPKEPQKIAFVHLNQVGDLLFTFPAISNVRARYPDAHLASIVRSSCAELLRRSNLVDEIMERSSQSVGTCIKIAQYLRKERFDMVVLFSTAEAAWITAQFSGAQVKAGFTEAMNGWLLRPAVQWTRPPSTANDLRLTEAIGCTSIKTDYVGLLKTEEADREAADKILREAGLLSGDLFAIMSQGTSKGRELKSWTDEGFASTADRIGKEYGMKSVVVGLDGGSRICGKSTSAVDLTGRTSLPVLAAVLERARIFVGIDSGVMHLAAAMGIPAVALFGPSDPEITGPQGGGHRILRAGLECSPCFRKECETGDCMKQITVDQVMAAVSDLLGRVQN